MAIVAAATANIDFRRLVRQVIDSSNDGGGRQLRESCLDVFRDRCINELWLKPGEIEVFAPSALRGRLGEIFIRQQTCQQFLLNMAARCPDTIPVVWLISVQADPLVQQCVAGTGIETEYGAVLGSRQPSEIGDAADVHDDPMDPRFPEKPMMERRNEWRAFATGRQVARTEVGDRRNAGFFGNHRWIADLPGKGMWRMGAVAYGLAVATDGADPG